MRNNPIVDCFNLFYVESLKIKNTIIDSFSNPLAAIKSIIRYTWPVAIMGWSYYTKATHKGGTKQNFNVGVGIDIAGAIVILCILLLILGSIYFSAEKYNPSQFTISDVNYLFPSPISQRTIYVFTMIRSSLLGIVRTLITLVVYWFLGSTFYSLQGSKAMYVIIGFFVVSIFSKSVGFLAYSLSSKFNIGKHIKTFIIAFSIFLILYLVWSLRKGGNIFNTVVQVLNGKVFSNIPVVGWAKDIIISPLIKESNPILQTMALVVVTIIILALAVYFANDYYEEASESTEYRERIMQAAKNKDNDEVLKLQEQRSGKKADEKKKIDINVNGKFNGVWAFAWKQAIKTKRINGAVFFGKTKLVTLTLALIIGFIFRDKAGGGIITLYLSGFIGISLFVPMSLSPLKDEMKNQYIYLLPGRARYKILAVHSVTAINVLINCALITFPILIIDRNVLFIEILSIFILLVSAIYLIYLSVLIMTLIMPVYDDGKNGIFIYIMDVILFSPAIAATVITGLFITHIQWVLILVFSLATILIVITLLFLSDWLFSKVELK